ncbi:type II toxin-antitoxin system death-on-curing family toxin [Mycoplasma sp. CB776]
MKKKLVFTTEKEGKKFSEFLLKFKNNLLLYEDAKYYLKENKEEIIFENIVLDFQEEKSLNEILELLKLTIERSFETVRTKFPLESDDDYNYVNINDNFYDIFERKIWLLSYEVDDIFDFFSISFISVLEKHKLRNGNKRFSFAFLINLLIVFGYYFKWSNEDTEIAEFYKKQQEKDIFCFVTRLSNRSYEDLIANIDDAEFKEDNQKNEIYKNCFNFIKQKDINLNSKDRIEKVKKEIKEWIIQNTLILI